MLLEYRGVTGSCKGFGLKEVSFCLDEGYLMGLLGKNGAGKTTLMKYLLEPDMEYSGEILLDGQDIRTCHKQVLDKLGFVADENRFWKNASADENGRLLGPLYSQWDGKRFHEIMKAISVPMGRSVGEMSRGEYIKFQLAFACAHHPRLYLLDEATAGMDPIFRRDFFQLLRELLVQEEAAVLMTTHLQTDVDKNMDYIGVLEEGRLVSFGENMA